MTEGKPKRSAYLPVVGFIIAVVLGAVAWLVAPSVIDALPFIRNTGLPLATTRPLFTVIIVLLGLVIFGLVAALTTPKDAQRGSEREVEQAREALRRRQKDARADARKSKGRR